MDLFSNLALGFAEATTLSNLGFCLIGVLLGTLIGVLPGIGATATIAMLLPITFQIGDPASSLIMLAGIYYGAQYGGSTTAILVNLPGESGSVVTCIDGHQMARNGRAGAALAIAAFGSFFAGTVGTLLIAGFSPYLSKIALSFTPADYFSLMVLGLVAAIVLASGGLLKAFGMILIGLLLGTVGIDLTTGIHRYTFGSFELVDGLDFTALAMGLFAFGDIMANAGKKHERQIMQGSIRSLWPNRQEFRESWPAVVRGTALGSVLGLLPGGGATLSSFASYSIEKKISRTPERFGKGAPAGVAAPEAANNAGAQSSFIPMLTLGIPSNGVMAMMIGAMMIHNIVPGPEVMTRNADLFWGLVASMWIGNLMLVIINLPLIGIWVSFLRIPYSYLYLAILVLSMIGLYSITNSPVPIFMAAGFGVLGYAFNRLGCEPAPLLLGFILGPMMEVFARRALLLSRGDPSVFVTDPLSASLLAGAILLLISVLSPAIRRKREEVFAEE